MTSDWSDACDPVPARRELTDEQRARLHRQWKRWPTRALHHLTKDTVPAHWIDADFDEMGA